MKTSLLEPAPLSGCADVRPIAYGCVFCQTGKEACIAKHIESQYPGVRARAVCQVKRHTVRGNTSLEQSVLLNGYVLMEAPTDIGFGRSNVIEEAISLLTYTDGDWQLYGEDESYARWVFRHNGLIGLSKAYKVGDQIQIVDGPLKDLEGAITRIDRRNRSGQVTLTFGGKQLKVWLGFEIINSLPDQQ